MRYGGDTVEVGDMISFVGTCYPSSAEEGARAIVISIDTEHNYIRIKWTNERNNGLRNKQQDGHYDPKYFRLVERLED